MSIEVIFDKLYEYFGVNSDIELAQRIGISQPAISKWRTREAMSAVKKKCRELGIYNEIFGNSMSEFQQYGDNGQQIKVQHNKGSGMINNNIPVIKTDTNIDLNTQSPAERLQSELKPLFDGLCNIAVGLQKERQLKDGLAKLISDLSIL